MDDDADADAARARSRVLFAGVSSGSMLVGTLGHVVRMPVFYGAPQVLSPSDL